ncbi:MAG: GNAT family N-acetyltransferase [Anaerolineae bacterium]
MSIEIRQVHTARERRRFLTFPWRVYRDDPLWVPPLLPERAKTIDPERGAFFSHGEAAFFMAWRDGHPAGTICAAEDKFANAAHDRRDAIFGFFEVLEDYEVAAALFAQACAWARAHSLDTLTGPFNLDHENSYGVLIEGRDRPPTLLCGHTPPYYQDFVERYGFRPARPDNVAMAVDITEETPALRRLAELAAKVRQRRDFVIRGPDLAHWDDEIDRLHRLLNASLAHLQGFIGWHRADVEALVAPFRQIADLDLILFADADGETVGWLPGVPNLNEVFIHVNGLRYPWDYVRLWWHMGLWPLKRRQPRCLTIKSVLVLPEYWSTGVAALLFDTMAKRARAKGFEWVDLSITSMDNPQTVLMGQHMGAEIYKRWRVYTRDA